MDYIVFDKEYYPVRELWINGYKKIVKISSEELNDVLLDSAGNYQSNESRMIDEQIFFYVPERIALDCSDEEVAEFVHRYMN